jgi:hypothetical protein
LTIKLFGFMFVYDWKRTDKTVEGKRLGAG